MIVGRLKGWAVPTIAVYLDLIVGLYHIEKFIDREPGLFQNMRQG